ncbi:MAG: hypothetical protein E7593_04270 [Ruminococcaceae bacterium]|nr:hypothetical protein [Oscillospiraceae bacterium]
MKKALFFITLIFTAVLILSGCGEKAGSASSNNSPTLQTNDRFLDNTSNNITDSTEKSETNKPNTESTDTESDQTTNPTPDEEIVTPKPSDRVILNHKNMKAMWLSQFDLTSIYSNYVEQRSEKDFRNKIKTVLKNVSNSGCNTIMVQIRPYADSFYPSEYYPPSRYVTGSYSSDFSYDPFKIIVEEAHKINLSVHAWFNPLRAMTTSEIKDVDNTYKIKQWYNDSQKNGTYLVEYNGRFYLNPAYSEVRQLIVDGVNEIVQKYNVDGVHMDDYFYPTTDASFDSKAYNNHLAGGSTISLKQFRHNNLNMLVSSIYSTVKAVDKELQYGISPEGNMNNSIEKGYADIYTWCSSDGYIDYICPQIYFGFEHQSFPFDTVADKWNSIIKNSNVRLIVGLTLGKALDKHDQWAGTGADEWADHNNILKRCIEYTKTLDKCSGVAFFSYQHFYDPNLFTEIEETKAERDNFIPTLNKIIWR